MLKFKPFAYCIKSTFANMCKLVLLVSLVSLLTCQAEWVKEMENDGLFEGDIVLRPGENNNGYASINNRRWPNGKVPYKIDSTIPTNSRGRTAIAAAIADYHKYTCLKFQEVSNPTGGYILFRSGTGCSSPVGYSGRANRITLGKGCWYKKTVMHEIGHSIGLYHEQSRPDRDNYVVIEMKNIQPKKAFNFNKQSKLRIDSLGTPYDYASMMHYGERAFSSNSLPTIRRKNGKTGRFNNRIGFSDIDKLQINLMYPCNKTPTTTTATTTQASTGTPSSCTNLKASCSVWEKKGYCKVKFEKYMTKNCRKSCKIC